jgi:hypothetical protein
MKERIVRRAKGITVTKDGYGRGRTYRLYSRGLMDVEFETRDARAMKDYMRVVHNIR